MADEARIEERAAHAGFSAGAVAAARESLRAGGGRQAQFDHPELGGMGQWSSGGMLMIGDMFNDALKARVRALFDELAGSAADTRSPEPPPRDEGAASWWPAALGAPASSGAQNDVRYAIFPDARRVAIARGGEVTVYDSGDHRITGIGQQQGTASTLRFSSADGPVAIDTLRKLSE